MSKLQTSSTIWQSRRVRLMLLSLPWICLTVTAVAGPQLGIAMLSLTLTITLLAFTLSHPSLPLSPQPLGTNKPVVWSIGEKSTPQPPSVNDENAPATATTTTSGVRVYADGDVYEGEFHGGNCSGSGVYIFRRSSGRFEGDWINGRYDGAGVETWARGSRYRGQYQRGLRHGIGVYRFFTGDVYSGEWSGGQCHGVGTHECGDGSEYIGEFKWGVKHGLGRYHFRNGDTYAGEYFADKMHGFGVYRFANGHRYEGAWHEGRRQGLGSYTFRNGQLQSGHWQNGVLDVSSVVSTTPESPRLVNHARVLHAVQEAQRAAEKAQRVGFLEERVKGAIAAANKAATAARVAAVKAVQAQMHQNYINDLTIQSV